MIAISSLLQAQTQPDMHFKLYNLFETSFYSINQNRYARKNSQGGQSSIYSPAPEYDDPANCAEEDQYVSFAYIDHYDYVGMTENNSIKGATIWI